MDERMKHTLRQSSELAKFIEPLLPGSLSREAASLIGLFYYTRTNNQLLEAAPLSFQFKLKGVDVTTAAEQAANGLTQVARGNHPGQPWRLSSRDAEPIAGAPHSLVLHGDAIYRWAPSTFDVDRIGASDMSVDCRIEPGPDQKVTVLVSFRDQLAWFFSQSHDQVERTLNVMTGVFKSFKSLSGVVQPNKKNYKRGETIGRLLAIDRVMAAVRLGHSDNTGRYLEEATSFDPSFAPAWMQIGSNKIVVGDYRAAIDILSKAIKLDQELRDAFLMRATSYQKLDLLDEAVADFRRARVLATPGRR